MQGLEGLIHPMDAFFLVHALPSHAPTQVLSLGEKTHFRYHQMTFCFPPTPFRLIRATVLFEGVSLEGAGCYVQQLGIKYEVHATAPASYGYRYIK